MRIITNCLLLIFFTVFLNNGLSAQIMEVIGGTTPPVTPENLITNIFLGDGVEVLNVTYSGDGAAVGYFTNGENVVGIERGIILTSGRASSPSCNGGVIGANCKGTDFASNDASGGNAEADLQDIATGALNDVAKYTITFIPTADTLRFKYVFASEEYPEWACTSFNDVFGFFISGPGISGPFENNGINIAQIPGTTLPVSINNINPSSCGNAYVQYYHSHENSNIQPVYDGYLDVFIAEVVVQPCETYTIKLAVADVGDNAYDTGVFLEAKSFGTGSLQVETATVSLDGTVTEGCAQGSITFSLPNHVESDYPLDYTIIGTAQNGVDYVTIPGNVFIPQGDSSVTIEVVGIPDGIDEPLESIGIDIQRDVCNRDTFWVYIRDNEILPPDLGPDLLICQTDTVVLHGGLPIPLPEPPSFTNTQDVVFDQIAPLYSSIQVAGVQPVILGPGVIQSVCVNIQHKWVDDLDLYLLSPGGQFIELSTFNGANCDNYNQVCFAPTATTPIDFQFPWTPCGANVEAPFSGGTYLPEGVWEDLWDGDHPTNGTWQLLVRDNKDGFDGTLLDWTITFEPLYQVNYEWTPATGLSCTDCPEPVANPAQTTTYHLSASDTYGCMVDDSITVEVLNVLPAPDVLCSNVTINNITFEWQPVIGATGYEVSVEGGPWGAPNNGSLSQNITGLLLGDTITIEVRATGNCNGAVGTATCFTPSCNAPSLNVTDLQNATCNGTTDASVNVIASGGAGDFTYSLGAVTNTTGIFSGLAAGIYNISVVDSWNCPNGVQVNLSQPDALLLDEIIINQLSCNGSDDGSATVQISGGIFPYNFLWNGAQTDSIATNLSIGPQTVQVTDVNGCTSSLTTSALMEPAVLTLNMAADSAACFGANSGSAQVLVAGGTPTYLFNWNAGAGNATTSLVQNLAAGSYIVTVTDINGCAASSSVTILQPAEISSSISLQNPFCFGSNDGSVTAMATGGGGPFTFVWSNGTQTATDTALVAGFYLVTITDANGCTTTNSATLISQTEMSLILTPVNLDCGGDSNGSISQAVSGGVMPYTFSWSNGNTTPGLSGLSAGNFCLTVTDANGCTIAACTEIQQPPVLTLSSVPLDAGCNGGTSGAINLTVTGGTTPYSYLWEGGQTSEDLTGLSAGSYLVTVSDANGCTVALIEDLSESGAISMVLTPANINCNGGSNGSISANVTGGSGSFTYLWSSPNGFTSTQANISGLQAGSYTLVVEDPNGCSAQSTINVTQPASGVSAAIAQPGIICFGASNGTVTATASGGTPPYSFAWSNGQNTASAVGLNAGAYTVTATDATGCQDVQQVEIIQEGQLAVALIQTPATCNNGTDGTATISAITTGGSPSPINDFGIQWSNGAQTPNIQSLIGGQSYEVTVTNALGCTASVSIPVGNPAAVLAQIQDTENVKCAAGRDGAATAGGIGGTLPYNFLWDANAESQVTATAFGLPPGTFQVTVTDANGCSATTSADISEPEALELRFENEKVKCFGEATGASLALADGGVAPYQFAWSQGAAIDKAIGLAAGTYQLTLTDANACTLVLSTEIEQPDAPLTADFSLEYVTCYGVQDGRIDVSATGGTPPYLYSRDGVNFFGANSQIALEEGFYDVDIRDKNGCLFSIDGIYIGEPEPIVVNLGSDTIVMFDTHLLLFPELHDVDTSGLVTYQWFSNNPQTQPANAAALVGDFMVRSPTTARLVVTDENGCQGEDLINIFVEEFRSVLVPTGFSPNNNGDSRNDLLHVHGNSFMVQKIGLFRVFDRWGEMVYEAKDFPINNLETGWNGEFKGKEMPAGVYVWYLEVDFVDGSDAAYQGQTTLIR